jgi:hypothetical protein
MSIPITPALDSADCQGPVALGAVNEADQERRPANDLRGRHLEASRPHLGLNCIKCSLVNNRQDIDCGYTRHMLIKSASPRIRIG